MIQSVVIFTEPYLRFKRGSRGKSLIPKGGGWVVENLQYLTGGEGGWLIIETLMNVPNPTDGQTERQTDGRTRRINEDGGDGNCEGVVRGMMVGSPPFTGRSNKQSPPGRANLGGSFEPDNEIVTVVINGLSVSVV